MESLQSYINSGDYFTDARKWYHDKYTHPLSHRSFVFIFSLTVCILFLGMAANIYILLPVTTQMQLTINTDSTEEQNVQIMRANHIKGEAINSIADTMIRNYVKTRENYRYSNLKNQFIFIQNNSSRLVFRKFYNYMNIDNPSSPIMIYQKNTINNVEIISIENPDPGQAIVNFRSKAHRFSGKLVNDELWQVTVSYEIDQINPSLLSGSRFGFMVTNYQSKLLKNNDA